MIEKEIIFFVAFEFPPLGGAGVQRSLKFVKYLPLYNVQPIVITVKAEDYPFVIPGHSLDESLCNDIPTGTIIERIHCASPKTSNEGKFKKWIRSFFSVVENYNSFWEIELVKKLPGLIKKHNPKAIYISLPPFAMAPLWMRLLKRHKIPAIVDFRDAWTQWCVTPNTSFIHYKIKLALEQKALGWAKYVVCSSRQIMTDMQMIHPSVNPGKFCVINNGYDGELNLGGPLNISVGEKFIVGYVGSFYYTPESRDNIFKPWWKKPLHRMIHYVPRKEDWLYRSPYFFFSALAQMIRRNPALSDKVEIRFAGKTPGWLQQQISEFGLGKICRHYGYLKHDAVIDFQKECDALLITSSKVLSGRDYSIAGKTYEYFTIGKPILAFVCEGEQKDILIESGLAILFDPDDIDGSAKTLEKIFCKGINLVPDKAAIQKYHRKLLTSKLADLVYKI